MNTERLDLPSIGSQAEELRNIVTLGKEKANKRNLPKLSKVRTGCLTCRSRRVKCDEGKPACQRCIKYGADCEGYPQSRIRKAQEQQYKQVLVPKTAIHQVRTLQYGLRFQEEEGRYFRFFYEDIAGDIMGPYNTTLWGQILPQAAESEPFIAFAVLALGALAKSRYVKNDKTSGSKGLTLLDPHHQFAVKQYCKALKGIREFMTRGPVDSRFVLMACVLAFCYESLEGNQAAAFAHARGGVQWMFDQHVRGQIGKPIHPSAVRCCTNDGPLEQDLMIAFSSLDLQAHGIPPTELDYEWVRRFNKSIAQLSIYDMSSSRVSWLFLQTIMRRNSHWLCIAREEVKGHNHSKTKKLDGQMVGNAATGDSTYEIPASLLYEQEKYFEDIRKWENASKPFIKSNGNQAGGGQQYDFYICKLLKIHAAYAKLLLAGSFHPPESTYSDYLSEFLLITELSEEVYPLLVQQRGSRFHFDLGILPPLHQVVMNCQDQEVRAKALELLFRTPGYREGIWESAVVGRMAESCQEL